MSDWAGNFAIEINAGGVVDPLGRSIIYSATGLPEGLSIDANTGILSGIYHAGVDPSGFDRFTVTIQASVV